MTSDTRKEHTMRFEDDPKPEPKPDPKPEETTCNLCGLPTSQCTCLDDRPENW